jgi:Tfp pilus assembly protein PilF
VINQEHTEAEALFFMGIRSMEAGDTQYAEVCFSKAVQIDPYFSEAYANLGLMLDRRGVINIAEDCYRHSIELNPSNSETYLNLGALLANRKQFDEAEAYYKQAIKLKDECPIAWSNLGALYACMKREEEAERCYRSAIALDSDYAKARFNLSYLLLRQGRFEEGWYCLEARNWYEAIAKYLVCPRWKGESLAGKSILISYEAGYGDVIQFCRYAAVLKAQGAASITMICHPPLKRLLASMQELDTVISYDENITTYTWDFWTPLLSIPYHCKTCLDTIPAKIPYLGASPNLIEKWRSTLPKAGLNVGLVWKGNPLFENDADRSLPLLEVLAPLWNVAGVNFISLQKGAGELAIGHLSSGLPLINLGCQLEDFADTAAVAISLDLLICVDTAVAHLAGALGKPCWVLLPDYKTDWRWLTNRTDSPWYPKKMRLFRQQAMGDWTSIVQELVFALSQLVVVEATQSDPPKREVAESTMKERDTF